MGPFSLIFYSVDFDATHTCIRFFTQQILLNALNRSKTSTTLRQFQFDEEKKWPHLISGEYGFCEMVMVVFFYPILNPYHSTSAPFARNRAFSECAIQQRVLCPKYWTKLNDTNQYTLQLLHTTLSHSHTPITMTTTFLTFFTCLLSVDVQRAPRPTFIFDLLAESTYKNYCKLFTIERGLMKLDTDVTNSFTNLVKEFFFYKTKARGIFLTE